MNFDVSIYYDMVNFLATTENAEKMLSSIDDVVMELYKYGSLSKSDNTGESFRESLKKHLSDDQISLLLEILKKKDMVLSVENIETIMSELKTVLHQAKIVHLTLAINPNKELTAAIMTWLRQEFPHTHLLLEFEHDPSIIAGAIIIFSGKYWDRGVKKEVEEWFKNKSITSRNSSTSTTS
jgi:F0F1-type ATP synthase delta subunit